jgi:WD40 repeat protein
LAVAAILFACGRGAGADNLPLIVSVGDERAVCKWDAHGKSAGKIASPDDAPGVVVFAGGRSIATGSEAGMVHIYDIVAGRPIKRIDTGGGEVTAIAASPDGKFIAAASSDQHIRVYDRQTGLLCGDVSTHEDSLYGLVFLASDELASGGGKGVIRLWSVRQDGLAFHGQIEAHQEAITALSTSPDSRILASVSADGFMKTWQDGALLDRVRVSSHPVRCVAFSPDGKTLATGDEDGRIRLWNASNGAPLPFMGGHTRTVRSLGWASDGDVLVSCGEDHAIRYWDARHSRQIGSAEAESDVKSIAVLP